MPATPISIQPVALPGSVGANRNTISARITASPVRPRKKNATARGS